MSPTAKTPPLRTNGFSQLTIEGADGKRRSDAESSIKACWLGRVAKSRPFNESDGAACGLAFDAAPRLVEKGGPNLHADAFDAVRPRDPSEQPSLAAADIKDAVAITQAARGDQTIKLLLARRVLKRVSTMA